MSLAGRGMALDCWGVCVCVCVCVCVRGARARVCVRMKLICTGDMFHKRA